MNAATANAFTLRNLIAYVAVHWCPGIEEIAEDFGCTPEQAKQACYSAGLHEVSEAEGFIGAEGISFQCWSDWQDDPEAAVAHHGKGLDNLDAPILGGDETAPETFPAGTEPHNPITGGVYSGGNVGILCATGYQSLAFAGFSQWADNGRMVNKGESCTYISRVVKKKDPKTGEEKSFVSKPRVFAIEQTHVMSEEEKAAWAETKAKRAAKKASKPAKKAPKRAAKKASKPAKKAPKRAAKKAA